MSTTASLTYWEDRAQRYAREGAGLRAVCSYGMPLFYNTAIHWTQWLALRRWIHDARGKRVLDVGCGVGRWSRMMARGGADVTGVDLSPTMVEEARSRTSEAGLTGTFIASDLAHLDLGQQFDRIIGVTVLQHILDDSNLETAIGNLALHLAPGGRMVLLEAAPTREISRCDTAIFRAQTAAMYRERFERAGLKVVEVTGVDPAPFKTWYLPFHRALPRWIALPALFAVTVAALPLDLIFGRRLRNASWHKVFVLEHR
jgi:2-polyprenyl-3-methyl-5-hydroxy-6-metoxy-1,4-benzoquinol methylase